MSLEQIYTRFLAAPRRDALADSASIHYITTAVSLSGPDKIVAQLAKEQHDKGTQLKKRVEKPLATVQTGNSLVIEMDTEIEFLTSGANWLPGLDDNFLADHIVRFPVVRYFLDPMWFLSWFCSVPLFSPLRFADESASSLVPASCYVTRQELTLVIGSHRQLRGNSHQGGPSLLGPGQHP